MGQRAKRRGYREIRCRPDEMKVIALKLIE
jgi:hypothetical protein